MFSNQNEAIRYAISRLVAAKTELETVQEALTGTDAEMDLDIDSTVDNIEAEIKNLESQSKEG